ncbi:NADH-quinone oxidoreductase subunit C [Fodinisporobacter ferrooxydans]|uniref:NADH-quinone oxidoreductase subunit C n=1 Tax=Fodinisporobacter ferrooxydans TaxID=2901836 RepID=A0ABY4CGK7_9BACL|nr:NADH-quinone oxidoreductase subunit C [Alicyclobacillaceae bacterium MYW30-H2]
METIIRADRFELPAVCSRILLTGARFLTMVATDEIEAGVDRFVLRYFFLVPMETEIVIVESLVPVRDPSFASVTPVLPAASWYEREIHDLFGIHPQQHPDLRPLILHEDWPTHVYPLRREYPVQMKQPRIEGKFIYPQVEGEGVFEVPVGPIHAGIIEPGHFRFQVMGDSVLHLEAKLFYTHRGIEKRSEGMPLKRGLFLAERICGVCSVSHALSYSQAVEHIAGITVSPRAAYIRTIVAELERLYNHVGDIGNICAGVGFAYGSNHGARLKETLMQLNDRVTGHRYLRGMIDLGGVRKDLTIQNQEDILQVLQDVQKNLQEIVDVILANDIVIDRFANTGRLEQEIAKAFAATGPTARASGLEVDARVDFPYAAYEHFDIAVPTLAEGDVLARYRIRILEANQSIRILQEAIETLPEGDLQIHIPNLEPYQYGIGITESPRGETIHFLMIGKGNTIYRYRVRSASYANWPVVPFTVPGTIIADFPLINKSFELCYACCDR